MRKAAPTLAVCAAAACLWAGKSLETAPPPSRVLPLNRFPASRNRLTDVRGFYLMPTAVEDDYFDGTSPVSRVRRHLELARRAGASYFRCAFSWNAIEKARGRYDWTFWDSLVRLAEHYHVGLIPYVAYSPRWAVGDDKDFWKQPPVDPKLYGDFMNRIAARYRGRIAAWEIWNEPDNRDYWTGTAEQFAALTRIAARRIREADPNAVLVLGGMAYGPSPFLDHLIADEHLDRYVDVVAMHAYPETWLNARAETVFQQWIPAVWEALEKNGSGADLWINEMGYADYRFRPNQASVYGIDVFHPYEHTASYQAAMLFKFEVMALASERISLTGWYRIDDFSPADTRLGSDEVNDHLGLVDLNGRVKPDLSAFEFFHRLLGGSVRRINSQVEHAADSQAVVDIFQRNDAKLIVIAWLRSSLPSEAASPSGMLPDVRSEVISVELPCGRPALVESFDPEGKTVRSSARTVAHRLEGVSLRGGQVFVGEVSCRN